MPLNIYRIGDDATFNEDEFELAKRFGDAAALALDNAQIRARLEHQAQTDAMTGLYNHRYFHERLRAELQRASRSHEPVGVLMLDIDDFKRANDVYGHAIGDEILAQLAKTLLATSRGSDVVCRLGGEEFAVIMPGTDSTNSERLAKPDSGADRSRGVRPVGPAHVVHGSRRRPGARKQPARADRVRGGGGDDDREGARQESVRALRRR